MTSGDSSNAGVSAQGAHDTAQGAHDTASADQGEMSSKRARRAGNPYLDSLIQQSSDELGSEHHHRDIQGGAARAAVFGVSDGLVSNTAIILGVAGAHPRPGIVRLVGLAGMLAGALSMAAGEYVSMRAQSELLERELEMEAKEIERRPDLERNELAKIYESRGLDADSASELAHKLMKDPATALSTHAREELGINPENLGSPWKASIWSLIATALGALVPLMAWLFTGGTSAVVITIVAAAFVAAGVGAALSRFTGRSSFFSAGRQLSICAASAAVTYAVGALVGVSGA
ncbi:MAG TPA: VIT1/CCC1 transporter family protein [Acidimicrobiales bacterium]|nr:VIT1/CCC1 transporter family protein [Acidimicrobiales bacterium]